MTPWHVLAFGGYTHTKFEPLIWRFDPFTRKWSQEAVDAVHAWRREHDGTIEGVAQSLVQLSIDRNILDNVTCIVIAFQHLNS